MSFYPETYLAHRFPLIVIDGNFFSAPIYKIQGALMLSSLFQIAIGFTGLVGFLIRFIGPVTIGPTVTLVGIALFNEAADRAGKSTCKL